MTFSEDFPSITPVNFFQIYVDCAHIEKDSDHKINSEKYLLPDTSFLCAHESFADVFMGWNEEYLEFYFKVKVPFKGVSYPEITQGDSLEIFIDTRDVKTARFNTRFCHHFFFLPEGVDGQFCGEITHFRTEESHPLSDSKDLKVKSIINKSGYSQQIVIPNHLLYGYDPLQCNRLGISYRINRKNHFPMHFSAVTEDFSIDQQPSMWATCNLVNN